MSKRAKSAGASRFAPHAPRFQGMAVVVLADQMASNVYPWQELCAREGLVLVVLPKPSAPHSWASLVVGEVARRAGGAGTVLAVAVPHVHWCDGSLVDLEAIGRCCRAHSTGALGSGLDSDSVFLAVDGTQVRVSRPSSGCPSSAH